MTVPHTEAAPAHVAGAAPSRTGLPEPPVADRTARTRAVTRLVVAAAVVLCGTGLELWQGITVGTVVAAALAPAWVGRLRRFVGARLLIGLVALCVASGVWLTALASADHTVTPRYAVWWSMLLVGLAGTVGLLLWARTLMRDATVAVLYAVGMLGGVVPGGLGGPNPWKFTLSVPVTVLLLGLAWRAGRRWLEVLLALVLAGYSALNDSRSHFAMLVLVAVLLVWQSWFGAGRRRRGRAWRAVVVLAALAGAVYSLGQALLLDGHLGLDAQMRTQAQVETAGSVVLGGRPEIGATLALVTHRPYGLGSGTSPTVEEVLVAKGGMLRVGYDPNNGYVENYMFGELVELHSMVGDLWALFGVPGILLAALVGWVALRGGATGLAARTLSALTGVLVARVLWDLFFGPLYSGLMVLALALALLLPRRSGDDDAPGPQGPGGVEGRGDRDAVAGVGLRPRATP